MVNIVTSIINRQYNFGKIKQYDNVIGRLRCIEGDEHCHLFEDGATEFCDTPIFACKFALKEGFTQFFAVANEDGKLAVVNVDEKAERFGTWAHANAIFEIAWTYNCMKLITASGDHTAKLFDITNCDIREVSTFYGHTRSVKTVSCRRDDPHVFATGGRDGHIVIWDTRTESHCVIGKLDRQILNAHFVKPHITRPHRNNARYRTIYPPPGLKSVTSLVFRDDNSLISCAAGDGLIKMWDLRKSYQNYRDTPVPKCIISYPHDGVKSGYSNLIIDKDFTRLYASCLDNKIYCYNVVTFDTTPIMEYTGYQNNTFYVKSSLSNDGSYLISGSSDENAYIWKTDCSSPYIRLSGHKAEVTSVAWCQSPLPVIVTCSDDMRHKIWRVGDANHPDNWHHICRGQAEVLTTYNSSRKPKKKRGRSSKESRSQVSKKFIVQCQNCSKVKHETSFCENCKPTGMRSQNQKVELDFLQKTSTSSNQEKTLGDADENNHNETPFSGRLDRDDVLCNSPTVNLPNFVTDGTAPHISQSPIKKRDIDWLTKMRKDRAFRKGLCETYSQDSVAKLTKVESPAKDGSNKKKASSNSPQTSLLKFFKIKTNKGDSLASSSKSLNYSFMTSPRSAT